MKPYKKNNYEWQNYEMDNGFRNEYGRTETDRAGLNERATFKVPKMKRSNPFISNSVDVRAPDGRMIKA